GPTEPSVGFTVLEQTECGLDRVFVERVDDPRSAGQVDVAVLDLGFLRRVRDAFDRNEDLHAGSFGCSRPVVTSVMIQSAARTRSNFFGRVPGPLPPAAACDRRPSTHARASSSSTPKIIRAAMCGGIDGVKSPAACAALITAPSMRRKSANSGLSYSF